MSKMRGYLGNKNLKDVGETIQWSQEQLEEYIKCRDDIIYFVRHHMKIINLDRGLIYFDLYPYQEKLITTIDKNRFTIIKFPRQSGKSQTVAAYVLHYVLFNSHVKVAILANKANTAKEILSRIKKAYELLPRWLQQGVSEWNKMSIDLENGSKIIAAATSSSAIRGDTFNIVVLDELAHVAPGVVEDFFSSTYPTITSGNTTKLIAISTPKGLNHFYKMWVDAEKGKNGYVPMKIHWSETPGRDEAWKKKIISTLPGGERDFKKEYDCDFLGSQDTLIDPYRLGSMPFTDPLRVFSKGFAAGLSIYEEPRPGRVYAMTVDVSRGIKLDYSAFVVIDITEMPYKVVAAYRNNEVPPLVFPTVIANTGKMYNNAYVLVEIKDIGQQIAELLYHDLEYPNILRVTNRKQGQCIDSGFGSQGRSTLGVMTTIGIKNLGCVTLKSMIEEEKLLVPDYHTINELSTFITKGKSYEAEEGAHDDMVMCLVLFGWLTTQPYFRDMRDINLRDKLYREKLQVIDEEFGPIDFFVSDGVNDTQNDPDGDFWF